MPTLRRKGRYWYLRVRDGAADREIATRCTDESAAKAWAVQWERDRADPEGAARRAARSKTLQDALDLTLAHYHGEARAGRLAEATLAFYAKKLGIVLHTLGSPPLMEVTPGTGDGYVARRRKDGACDHTIAKELHVLRAALALAKRQGWWQGDPRDIKPPSFSPGYKPRTRWLAMGELQKIIAELTPDRAAWVALAVGAGAELSALARAQRDDYDPERGLVRVRGTKNARRDRWVPVVLPECRQLVELAFASGGGAGTTLLRPWGKQWRDLQAAAARAEVPGFSMHSLRHTFATWHLAAGCAWDDVARAMGHADTTMLHRTYGHLDPEELRRRLAGVAGNVAGKAAGKSSPDVPRYGVEKVDRGDGVDGSPKRKRPSGEGLFGCRRSDLNQRPEDYDSVRVAPVIPLFVPAKKRRRGASSSPDVPRKAAGKGRR